LIILDENILDGQRLLLEASRTAVRQIGVDIGHKGLKDEEIVVLLRWPRSFAVFCATRTLIINRSAWAESFAFRTPAWPFGACGHKRCFTSPGPRLYSALCVRREAIYETLLRRGTSPGRVFLQLASGLCPNRS
jgi:hypothetical protein